MMKLCIKNMVCPRCIMVVEKELAALNIRYREVDLGYVLLVHPLDEAQRTGLTERLQALGFVLLQDPQEKQIETVKTLLLKVFDQAQVAPHFSVKKYLSAHLPKEYSYLSRLFSEREGLSIERYYLLLRLEKVKELLSYGELSLQQIAENLGYSSVQHLSAQFKKLLGVSTRQYRFSLSLRRLSLDRIAEENSIQSIKW